MDEDTARGIDGPGTSGQDTAPTLANRADESEIRRSMGEHSTRRSFETAARTNGSPAEVMPAGDHHLENPRLADSGLLQMGARSPTNLYGEPSHGANCGHGDPSPVAIGIPEPSPIRVPRTSHPWIAWRTRLSLSTVELENAAATDAGTFAIEQGHIATTDGRPSSPARQPILRAPMPPQSWLAPSV